MEKQFKLQLLTDKSRLQEIYNLRVIAWENSEMNSFINNHYHPNGWFDKLDAEAYHWTIEDKGKIISSSRICILQDLTQIEEDFTRFSLPLTRPFAYFSRLVIHPNYRHRGLVHLMDNARINFLKEQQIAFALAFGSEARRASLEKLGYIELGMLCHKYTENGKIDIDPAFILYLNQS